MGFIGRLVVGLGGLLGLTAGVLDLLERFGIDVNGFLARTPAWIGSMFATYAGWVDGLGSGGGQTPAVPDEGPRRLRPGENPNAPQPQEAYPGQLRPGEAPPADTAVPPDIYASDGGVNLMQVGASALLAFIGAIIIWGVLQRGRR